MNTLKTNLCLLIFMASGFTSFLASAAMGDEPVLVSLMVNELEIIDAGDQPLSLDAQAWVGTALKRFWLKTEGEWDDGNTEDFEMQALYSKAISSFWDIQAGLRHVSEPGPDSHWGVIGLQGLAPYFFEVDTALFIGESGDSAFRFNSEYDLLITQRLILTPEIELNFYGQDNARSGLGSGLSDVSAGVRLRYEFRRKFAPYIGFNWHKEFGKTADYSRAIGEITEATDFVIGLRGWF